MKAGDKFHIKDRDNWSEIIVNEHEVIEDTGAGLRARNCATGEEISVNYYQVTDWPRCAQCGKPRLQSELRDSQITFQDSRQEWSSWKRKMINKRFVDHKTLPFCADGPCHSHYQMGCEG